MLSSASSSVVKQPVSILAHFILIELNTLLKNCDVGTDHASSFLGPLAAVLHKCNG